jgi:hypothetical protein
MSTRANVIIKDKHTELYFYRHSDGDPGCTGESLQEFVKGYTTKKFRLDAMQSSGWLVIQGQSELKADDTGYDYGKIMGWKVGYYEPTNQIHGDVEYIYVIDLNKLTLSCHKPKESGNKIGKVCSEFKTVKF